MRYWIETLGCPKNHVDSEKLAGMLVSQGYDVAVSASEADLAHSSPSPGREATGRECNARRGRAEARSQRAGRPLGRRRARQLEWEALERWVSLV